MREIPQTAIDLVKQFEGCTLKRYLDAGSRPTIGYGHLIKLGENLYELTEEQALSLLHDDLRNASTAVMRLITVPLTDNEFSALISFTFNLGAHILQASTLRSQLNRGDLIDADAQFARWCYCGSIKLPGLLRRRQEEARLFIA